MAKNWTLAEAAESIKNGNKEAILDIGKRYPLFLNLVTRTLDGDKKAVEELLSVIPEYVTANKVNVKLKEGLGEGEDGTEESVEEPKTEKAEAKKPAAKKAEQKEQKKEEKDGEQDYEKMGAYPLYKLCKERGLAVKSKRPKEEYIAALRAADGESSESSDDDGWDDEPAGKYDGMTAQELFKECKKRGLKVEPKKPVEFYVEKLEADDAAAEKAKAKKAESKKQEAKKAESKKEEKDDDDGWDDDDDEEEEKPAPKKSKKSEPKDDDDDDDDDEWDI